MSDFVAFFPSSDCSQAPASFRKLDSILHGPLRADDVQSNLVYGAPVLVSKSFGKTARFYAKQDGSGWIIVKGVIFDVRSETPAVELEDLLDQILTEGPGDLNRYEGAFALAAWDSRKAQGWALNDQTSVLNLYYGEHDGGLYIATNALTVACALNLQLDPHSVLEFLTSAVLFAPATMFTSLRRLDVGEHIQYKAGRLCCNKHWHGYEPQVRHRDTQVAADAVAAGIVDRVSRYAAAGTPVISDLTGGLDTRLLVSAANAAGLDLAVTVNGPAESEDVRIAHRVAETLHLELRHFDTTSLWTVQVTPDMRRELVYRTSGELPFTAIYHHLLSRPLLSQDFNLHMMATGGDFYRTFPWEGSFKMRHRAFAVVPKLPSGLLCHDSASCFYPQFRSRIKAISREQPGASMTQQLDLAFIWKMTSHSSLYLSALHNWLPSVAPLMSAGVIKTAIAMPWTMRLGSQLQRQIVYRLSPRAAAVELWNSASHTHCGTAEPGIRSVGREIQRYLGRFARSVERRFLRGCISKRLNPKPPVTEGSVPFLTQEFRQFLNPSAMFSRAMYTPDGLHTVLSADHTRWIEKNSLVVRIATVEQLCRELDFRPEPDFWVPVMTTPPM